MPQYKIQKKSAQYTTSAANLQYLAITKILIGDECKDSTAMVNS